MAKSRIQKTVKAKERDGEYVPKNPDPPPLTTLPPPADLPVLAKNQWKKFAPILLREKVLTELDIPGFRLMCIAYARAMESNKKIEEYGVVTVSDTGVIKINPANNAYNTFCTTFNKFAEMFGCTPMGRKRIDVNLSNPDTKAGKYSKYKK